MGLITQTAKEYYTVANNFTGDGSTTQFTVTFDPLPSAESEFIVYQAGNEIDDDQYTYVANTGVITFTSAPTNGTAIQVKLKNIKHGSYRYIALDDIINNFMVSYVGDGKIIDNARKLDVLVHAKRAIQECSYDVSRIEKIQEVEVGASLTIPMPQDYVNYTQLAWIDGDGLERVIYPSKITSRPSQSILQDDTAEYLYDNDESLLTATSLTTERFKNVPNTELNDDYFYSDNDRNAMLGEGKRFGIDPETTQINGVFIVDEASGDVLGLSARSKEYVKSTHYFVRARAAQFNFSNNPTFVTGSDGDLAISDFINDPKVYITTVGLYDENKNLLAVAKASKPIQKTFRKETLIEVKLDY